MFWFRRKVDARKYDLVNEQIMELRLKRKELEQEVGTIQADLVLEKKEHRRQLQDNELKVNKVHTAIRDDFVREQNQWKEDARRTEKKLQEDHDRKVLEVTSLLKLDHAQQVKQLEIDYKRKLQDQEIAHKEEMMTVKSNADAEKIKIQTDLAQKYYDQMHASLSEFHTEGNTTTKFMHEMALKMIDRPVRASLDSTVLVGSPEKETVSVDV